MLNDNQQLNILAIIPYQVKPVTTGGQKSIALFYDYFSKLVNLTGVTVKSAAQNAEDFGYDLIPLFSESPLRYINPAYFFSLRSIIKRKSITHVMIDHPYFGWLGIMLKKMLGVKLVVRSHNIEGLRFKSVGKWWWRILWNYERMVHRSANLNFFVTAEDLQYAVSRFGLKETSCAVIPFGIEREQAPSAAEKLANKKNVCERHKLNPAKPLLLYSAALNYAPNQQGLDFILEKLNPLLLQSGQFYNILISGTKLAEKYDSLKAYADKNIVYAGFVNDIDQYFTAADIFLNPIAEGGGIKTKAVEALAANCTLISFENGAIGIPRNMAGEKLKVVPNNDAQLFATAVLDVVNIEPQAIPGSFFHFFSWRNIAQRAKKKMEDLSSY